MRKQQTTEEIESKRRQIMNAALELLAEEEYHKITIRTLAAKCQMAVGTFFNYFPSKENLFLYLLYEKSVDYFQNELKRFEEAAPDSVNALICFLLDSAKKMIVNDQDLITLFILHHEILSLAGPENVPEEMNRQYISSMKDLAAAIHQVLPVISEEEVLRHYSFLHAQLIGSRHLAPVTTMSSYYPAWFDADSETLKAFERYLKGAKEDYSSISSDT